MIRAIIYARFSPRRDEEHCISLETQIAKCRQVALSKGYSVSDSDILSDTAKSGASSERPNLWIAVEKASQRNCVLLVYRFDRLARDGFLAYKIEHDVLEHGGRLESATGEGEIADGMTPEEKLRIGVMRLFASFERDLIKARTSAGMKYRQSKGEVMTRRDKLPYGWKLNGDNKTMIEDTSETAIIGKIVALRDSGHTFRQIADTLKKEGAAFRGRPGWHFSTVRRIYNRAKSDS